MSSIVRVVLLVFASWVSTERVRWFPLPPVASVKAIVPLPADAVLIQMETFLQPIGWYLYEKGAKKLTRTALSSTSPADFSDWKSCGNSQPPRTAPRFR